MSQYAHVSLWFDQLNDTITRPSLQADIQADIAIIGAGYSGLWTAYYLKQHQPDLSVVILEADVVGYGASGRNGGWVQGCMDGEHKYLAGLKGSIREQAQKLIYGMVDEIGQVVAKEGIDCGFHKGGTISVAARYPEQIQYLKQELKELYAEGHTEADYRWLDQTEISEHVNVAQSYGGIYSPHCAVVQPAKLAQGLAEVVERLGVKIYEKSTVTHLEHRKAYTQHGSVSASNIVVGLEAFSGSVENYQHNILPVQSLIIATEPLNQQQWENIGLHDRPTLSDGARFVTYMQRTDDDRLVVGARGGYQFGGKVKLDFRDDPSVFATNHQILQQLFPHLDKVEVTHQWGGSLGVSRQFAPLAIYEPETGIASLGGYRGEGVAASNLFARTLVDLLLERKTLLSQMPWAMVGKRSKQQPSWEPEPLRWLAYQAINRAYLKEDQLCVNPKTPTWKKQLAISWSKALSKLLA